jgi:hypothetical protein
MYVKGTSTIKRLIKKLDAEGDITWSDSDKIYRIFLSSYGSPVDVLDDQPARVYGNPLRRQVANSHNKLALQARLHLC